jgi:hypothetical protein
VITSQIVQNGRTEWFARLCFIKITVSTHRDVAAPECVVKCVQNRRKPPDVRQPDEAANPEMRWFEPYIPAFYKTRE